MALIIRELREFRKSDPGRFAIFVFFVLCTAISASMLVWLVVVWALFA